MSTPIASRWQWLSTTSAGSGSGSGGGVPVRCGLTRPRRSSRASSSSTMDSSSLRNSGVGGASGRPAGSGTDSHRAAAGVVAGDHRVRRAAHRGRLVHLDHLAASAPTPPRRRAARAPCPTTTAGTASAASCSRRPPAARCAGWCAIRSRSLRPPGLGQLPRRLVGQVAVGVADHPHRLADRRLLPGPLHQLRRPCRRRPSTRPAAPRRRRSAHPAPAPRRSCGRPARPTG